MFTNITPFQRLLSIEILTRYNGLVNNADERDAIIIVQIVRKYTTQIDALDYNYAKMLKMTKQEFIDKAMEIMKVLDYKLYNPEINECFIKDNTLLNHHVIKNIEIESWFTDTNHMILKNINLKAKTIEYDISIEKMIRVINTMIELYDDFDCKNIRTLHLALYFYLTNKESYELLLDSIIISSLYNEKKSIHKYIPDVKIENIDKYPKNVILPCDYLEFCNSTLLKYMLLLCYTNYELISILKPGEIALNVFNSLKKLEDNNKENDKVIKHLSYLIKNEKIKRSSFNKYYNQLKNYINN